MMGHSLLGVSCLRCPSGWAASEQGPPGVPPPRGFSPAPPQVPPMHRWASPHHHTPPPWPQGPTVRSEERRLAPQAGWGLCRLAGGQQGLCGVFGPLWQRSSPSPIHTRAQPLPPWWPVWCHGPFQAQGPSGAGEPQEAGVLREKVLDSRPQRPCPAPRPILVGTAPPWSGPQAWGWLPQRSGAGAQLREAEDGGRSLVHAAPWLLRAGLGWRLRELAEQ